VVSSVLVLILAVTATKAAKTSVNLRLQVLMFTIKLL
jgi:hypothetical protein